MQPFARLIMAVAGILFPAALFAQALILDYSTYLGGTNPDSALAISVENGSAFITGGTYSINFPTVNAYQKSLAGEDWDAFVSKLSSSGSRLLYSTYLGGAAFDEGYGIAVQNGEAFVTGWTESRNFPTLSPYQAGFSGLTDDDAFVSRLSSSGSRLLYSTYLGGTTGDQGEGIAVQNGEAFVTGWTESTDFPVFSAFQSTHNGGWYDSFVVRFSSSGSRLIYSTYLGGGGSDYSQGIVADAGEAYVVGYTNSANFPTRSPYQASSNSADPSYYDAFLSKLSSSGSRLIYSTYLGGYHWDFGHDVAVQNHEAFICGYTYSNNFPVVSPYQSSLNIIIGEAVKPDAFVTRFSSTGSRLLYSTFLGGLAEDVAVGIAVESGDAYIAGKTVSTDFPMVYPYQASIASEGLTDIFLSRLSSGGSQLRTSTYLGGNGTDQSWGIVVSSGVAYLCGDTNSSDFPLVVPYQASLAGFNIDPLVCRFSFTAPPSDSTVHTDYNGDGTSDIAIFRPAVGLWSVRYLTRVYLGNLEDDPVPNDYDGDRTTDIAIFRPAASLWAVRKLSRFYFGSAGDLPVSGDYNGDGTSEAAIFRGSAGMWAVRNYSRIYFGLAGDEAVAGDYNGDRRKDVAIFRPAASYWSVRGLTTFYFGAAGDEPVPGDYGGSGKWGAAIFRPATIMWAIRNFTRCYLGSPTDWAVPANYGGMQRDEVGIFRDPAGLWSVRAFTRAYFGSTGDIPVTR